MESTRARRGNRIAPYRSPLVRRLFDPATDPVRALDPVDEVTEFESVDLARAPMELVREERRSFVQTIR